MSKKAWDLPWSSNDHRQGKSHSKGILSQGKFPCNGSCAADRDFLRATAFFGHGCVPTSGVCAGKGQKDRQCHSFLTPSVPPAFSSTTRFPYVSNFRSIDMAQLRGSVGRN